jgi:hypothetical protein
LRNPQIQPQFGEEFAVHNLNWRPAITARQARTLEWRGDKAALQAGNVMIKANSDAP